MHVRRPGARWGMVLAALAFVAGVSGLALASHIFSDVPTEAIYHDAVSWLVARGITMGCAASLYCPDSFVTRGQMALFLRRTGTALTPGILSASNAAGGNVFTNANPVVCPTGAYAPSYTQTARIHALVSILPLGAMNTGARVVYSTNGGTTWNTVDSVRTNGSTAVGSNWIPLSDSWFLDLSPGTSYRFAGRLEFISGTTFVSDFTCRTVVDILNRN